MNAKLSSTLPKDDKNGLAAIATDLIGRYRSQEHTVAIVVLKTSKVVQDEDFQHIPETKVVRIEPVIGELETDTLDILQRATEMRIGRKPDTLDLSDPETEFTDVTPEPVRAIEAGTIDAEIVEDTTPEPTPDPNPPAPVSLFGGAA